MARSIATILLQLYVPVNNNQAISKLLTHCEDIAALRERPVTLTVYVHAIKMLLLMHL